MRKVKVFLFVLLLSLIFSGCNSNKKQYIKDDEPYGVNLACADFGSVFPGEYGKDYIYPTAEDLNYWYKKGLRLIRMPFKWERLQLELSGPLNQSDLDKMKEFVRVAEKLNMVVILDLHNYCRRYMDGEPNLIGTNELSIEHLASFWKSIAQEFVSFKNIYGYGLMNEPHDLDSEISWFDMAQAAIDSIREVDTKTLIIVGGNDWSSAERWLEQSDTLRYLKDPMNNLAYEAHVYFDNDGSGTYKYSYEEEGCYPDKGVDRVRSFVDWLKKYNLRGFIGEYGIPDNDVRWNEVLNRFLSYLQEHNINGTYWAAGPWWGDYFMSITPQDSLDRPQMAVVEKYLSIQKK